MLELMDLNIKLRTPFEINSYYDGDGCYYIRIKTFFNYTFRIYKSKYGLPMIQIWREENGISLNCILLLGAKFMWFLDNIRRHDIFENLTINLEFSTIDNKVYLKYIDLSEFPFAFRDSVFNSINFGSSMCFDIFVLEYLLNNYTNIKNKLCLFSLDEYREIQCPVVDRPKTPDNIIEINDVADKILDEIDEENQTKSEN